jgi:hypothetical protein
MIYRAVANVEGADTFIASEATYNNLSTAAAAEMLRLDVKEAEIFTSVDDGHTWQYLETIKGELRDGV